LRIATFTRLRSSSIGHSRGQRGQERALERQASGLPHSLLQKPSAFRRRSVHVYKQTLGTLLIARANAMLIPRMDIHF
jgi:hypothetical protein